MPQFLSYWKNPEFYRQQAKKYYEQNRGSVLKRLNKDRKQNPKKYQDYEKKKYNRHRKKILKRVRKYYWSHRKERLKYMEGYCKTHKLFIAQYDSRRRKEPGNVFRRLREHNSKLSRKDFDKWWDQQPKNCAYCDIPLELGVNLSVDRKNPDKGYVFDNLVLACRQCNIVKTNILTYEEMKEIGRKYIQPKWLKFLDIK